MCSFAVRTMRLEPLARDVRRQRRAASPPAAAACDSVALELALEELDLRAGELIERLEVLVAGDARVGDDQDAVLDVIEREHRVEQHEPGVVARRHRRRRRASRRLEPRRRVVAEVADRAAGEARQARARTATGSSAISSRSVVDERLARVSVVAPARSIDRLAVARAQDQERILAEERVAADVLAAFDALEQERVVGVLGDLEERRDRRQQVGDDLLADRHERAALRQLHEFFERGHVSSAAPNSAEPRRARRSRITPAGGRVRSTTRTAPAACATSMSRPSSVSAAGARARRAAAASRAGCRRGRRPGAPSNGRPSGSGDSSTCGAVPTGVR